MTSVDDLELPSLDMIALDRDEALAAIATLRREHWLVRTPFGYLLTAYNDSVAILRDRRFHSALSLIPQMAGVESADYFDERRPSILAMEGDEHARLRRLVAPAFTPAAAERLRPFMRAVVTELVDAVDADGRCEFVSAVGEPYPIPIICELLGAPKRDWKRFSDWATDIFRIFNGALVDDLPAIRQASGALERYVRAMVEARRATPADDLLSAMISIEEAGDRLSTDELIMLAEAVLMAGTDTTRNQLACCMALFAANPSQWAALVGDASLAPRAVEETMRYLGAVRGTARVASETVEYRGVEFLAGTLVTVPLAGANRDPDLFELPDTLDITRERSTLQMTFGSGIHYCLGAALARAELQEALTILASRWPDLAADGPVEWKPDRFGIWGPARLPLRW